MILDRSEKWKRQGERFWRFHHEAWKRSDLNQREYCALHDIPLKAFGNWRAVFIAAPPAPQQKLLYRRGGLSPTLSPTLNPTLNPGVYPTSPLIVSPARAGHRRRFSSAERQLIVAESNQPAASLSDIARRYGIDRRLLRRWRQEAAPPVFVSVEINAEAAP